MKISIVKKEKVETKNEKLRSVKVLSSVRGAITDGTRICFVQTLDFAEYWLNDGMITSS